MRSMHEKHEKQLQEVLQQAAERASPIKSEPTATFGTPQSDSQNSLLAPNDSPPPKVDVSERDTAAYVFGEDYVPPTRLPPGEDNEAAENADDEGPDRKKTPITIGKDASNIILFQITKMMEDQRQAMMEDQKKMMGKLMQPSIER